LSLVMARVKLDMGWGRRIKSPMPFVKVLKKQKDMVSVSLTEFSIPHTIIGHYGAGRVLLKPASEGTGVIAGGPVRAVLEAVGVTNILTKCLGSNNPHNMVKATLNGLRTMRSAQSIAKLRGKTVEELAA